MMEWLLADAKNRFSELVTKALTIGPQRVSRRGQSVVVLSEIEYQSLLGHRKSLLEYISEGPDLSELDLARDTREMRSIDL